ncbi:hypothetical protein B9T29_04380 [Acinetobacter sp. ANC 3903]|nr:hypothetical protein B9T29_04380 [Acinetobacter sp. ANC 3903]
MVDSLIGSASQKRVHSKSQKWDSSKPQYWEYYRFRNDTNIGYIRKVGLKQTSSLLNWGLFMTVLPQSIILKCNKAVKSEITLQNITFKVQMLMPQGL